MDQNKMQEMQMLEQSLQNLLMQKQAFQMELTENNNASKEIKSSGDEVYKVIGQLMIKSDKNNIEKELDEKQKMLELRMKTLTSQEEALSKKLEDIRKEVIGK